MGTYLLTWLQMRWGAFHHDDRAVTAIEYGLIAAVMAAIIVAVFSDFGGALGNVFNDISTDLATPKTGIGS